ncbi:hypothetical protein ACTGYP_12940, partial [Streptococcus suis]
IHRGDYRRPAWLVPDIHLDFDLDPAATIVRARLSVTRSGAHDEPLRLDGAGQQVRGVRVDGQTVNDWQVAGDQLVVPLAGDAHVVETEVAIVP